jgi:hypothetical protein
MSTNYTRNELLELILSEVAGGGGGAVLTVTGGLVDNTDPINPIVNYPAALSRMLNTRAQLGNTVVDTGTITPIALTGTGNENLTPPVGGQDPITGDFNDYYKITELSEISSSGELTISGGEIVVGTNGAGDYRTPHAWLDVATDKNNIVIGFIFGIQKASDGLIYFSQRATGERSSAQDQSTNIAGGGFVTSLEAGDKLSVWAAASLSCNMTIFDANLGIEMAVPSEFKV